jgi:hypothetical protein
MRQCRVVAFRVPERFKEQHLHEVGGHRLKGLIAAMPDRRICRSKELLRPLDVCMGSSCGAAGAEKCAGSPSICSTLKTV